MSESLAGIVSYDFNALSTALSENALLSSRLNESESLLAETRELLRNHLSGLVTDDQWERKLRAAIEQEKIQDESSPEENRRHLDSKNPYLLSNKGNTSEKKKSENDEQQKGLSSLSFLTRLDKKVIEIIETIGEHTLVEKLKEQRIEFVKLFEGQEQELGVKYQILANKISEDYEEKLKEVQSLLDHDHLYRTCERQAKYIQNLTKKITDQQTIIACQRTELHELKTQAGHILSRNLHTELAMSEKHIADLQERLKTSFLEADVMQDIINNYFVRFTQAEASLLTAEDILKHQASNDSLLLTRVHKEYRDRAKQQKNKLMMVTQERNRFENEIKELQQKLILLEEKQQHLTKSIIPTSPVSVRKHVDSPLQVRPTRSTKKKKKSQFHDEEEGIEEGEGGWGANPSEIVHNRDDDDDDDINNVVLDEEVLGKYGKLDTEELLRNLKEEVLTIQRTTPSIFDTNTEEEDKEDDNDEKNDTMSEDDDADDDEYNFEARQKEYETELKKQKQRQLQQQQEQEEKNDDDDIDTDDDDIILPSLASLVAEKQRNDLEQQPIELPKLPNFNRISSMDIDELEKSGKLTLLLGSSRQTSRRNSRSVISRKHPNSRRSSSQSSRSRNRSRNDYDKNRNVLDEAIVESIEDENEVIKEMEAMSMMNERISSDSDDVNIMQYEQQQKQQQHSRQESRKGSTIQSETSTTTSTLSDHQINHTHMLPSRPEAHTTSYSEHIRRRKAKTISIIERNESNSSSKSNWRTYNNHTDAAKRIQQMNPPNIVEYMETEDGFNKIETVSTSSPSHVIAPSTNIGNIAPKRREVREDKEPVYVRVIERPSRDNSLIQSAGFVRNPNIKMSESIKQHNIEEKKKLLKDRKDLEKFTLQGKAGIRTKKKSRSQFTRT